MTTEDKPLRAFVYSHSGQAMGGYSLVLAPTESAARVRLYTELLSQGMGLESKIFSCREVDITTPSVFLIWDGDY